MHSIPAFVPLQAHFGFPKEIAVDSSASSHRQRFRNGNRLVNPDFVGKDRWLGSSSDEALRMKLVSNIELWLPKTPVPSENTEVPIVREIMIATTMSSLFVALFALIVSTFRTRAALQTEILALRSPTCGLSKQRAASLAPPTCRPAVVDCVVPILVRLAAMSSLGSA